MPDLRPIHSQVVCIGVGLSGLALAIRLQQTIGCRDIRLYDRNDGPGGVWAVHKYPGVACDIPADFYSFSFSPPPKGWSKFRPDGREFEQYLRDTATKHDLWPLMTFNTACEGAVWMEDSSLWLVSLRDQDSGRQFQHSCDILCIATGNLTRPKSVNITGLNMFQGPVMHTSRWDTQINVENKNIAVFGNGASGCQLVPQLLPKVSSLIHVFRSPQWYIRPVGFPYGRVVRWVLGYIPLARKVLRFLIAFVAELAFRGSPMTERAARIRRRWEESAANYIKSVAPKKYHTLLIPDHAMGCRRPVFNGGYLESLHDPKIELVPHDKVEVVSNGISYNGEVRPIDVIILATGYSTNISITDFPITGRSGEYLEDHWNRSGGPTAYGTIAVHGFPNLFFVKGPNTGTGHTSTILVIENVLNLIIGMMKPLICGEAKEIEVRQDVETKWSATIQEASRRRVWYSGCTSWYIREDGWNGTVYPWSQLYCWWFNLFPRWSDWSVITNQKLE
ncbi:hypothetical protein M422DRAFT_211111 [Sphaerobolus stellatus SS14]|uniref:L-ornithine N(5)-monooxygenase [NAD(P)H] n=1 Tax=Sphaerobolus stellatus (strain SS14) TaxID=990650 RepID=A0A0C9VJF6_SPHS4|nr:hypothetical protein M422DRAFT_211111 [Sphaerobolus stellatus SS14]